MSNSLDPIWDAHLTAQDALKVVRRCITVGGIDRAKAFSNTRLDGLMDRQCIHLLGAAQTEVNDSAVLSLYATFEARLRDHIAQQAHHLHAAQQPNPDFGIALATSFSEYCDGNRMNDLADLFASAVGQVLVAQVGNIRAYRHWLAHGRRWAQPPNVTPAFAYQTLAAFLQAAGLT
jgi:hypothetical protein